MTRVLHAFALIAAILVWGWLSYTALDRGWGHRPLANPGDLAALEISAREMAEQRNFGNLSVVFIEAGVPKSEFHLSRGESVSGDTIFQVASLSKWLTAWGVMALVQDRKIDLDAPVATYLTRWELPQSEFDTSKVTVRRLLSHTAGLTDGLGYDGFADPGDRQSLEASLTNAADASSGKVGMTVLGQDPGTEWNYSGGGFTLLQLVIEEVSGQAFPEYMEDRVFGPLGMRNTTFYHTKAKELGLAENYRPDGSTEAFRWYTALAATSLFTSSDDLASFIALQTPGGKNPVLDAETLALMRTAHASSLGADIWGLGVMLYAPNNIGGFIVGHDGSNEPAINTAARFDPATGNGIVALSTGDPTLATEIAGEWVFWATGNVDSLTFAARLPAAIAVFAAGVIVIILASVWSIWRRRRLRPA